MSAPYVHGLIVGNSWGSRVIGRAATLGGGDLLTHEGDILVALQSWIGNRRTCNNKCDPAQICHDRWTSDPSHDDRPVLIFIFLGAPNCQKCGNRSFPSEAISEQKETSATSAAHPAINGDAAARRRWARQPKDVERHRAYRCRSCACAHNWKPYETLCGELGEAPAVVALAWLLHNLS